MIESIQNNYIKKIISLNLKKYRDKFKQFIIEGEKFINEIPHEWNIHSYLFSESFIQKTDISVYKNRAEIYIIKDTLFKKISQTVNPQGILAVCNKKSYLIEELFNKKIPFILVGENISDPGNLGTLIRTADAAGCSGILLSKTTVDMFNPKVIRSTAGSIFNIPIINELDINDIFKILRDNRIMSIASHLKANTCLYDLDLTKSCAILIGNESKGLSQKISNLSDMLTKIPISGKAESLNASVASGVMLYEVLRQRRGNKNEKSNCNN